MRSQGAHSLVGKDQSADNLSHLLTAPGYQYTVIEMQWKYFMCKHVDFKGDFCFVFCYVSKYEHVRAREILGEDLDR